MFRSAVGIALATILLSLAIPSETCATCNVRPQAKTSVPVRVQPEKKEAPRVSAGDADALTLLTVLFLSGADPAEAGSVLGAE
jgi:hypothetical protein